MSAETADDRFVLDRGGWRGLLARGLFWIGHTLFRVSFSILWRLRVVGREQVPRQGALLFAANHASFADPPLVGSSVPRPIYFMAKEELFQVPLFGWLIHQVNAFPIRRKEGDVGAFRTAQRILAAGGAMIIFPEGKRQRLGVFGRPKSGVGLLAIKTGVPVVPVYVHDTHRLLRFPRLTVVFGAPLTAVPGETPEILSRRIMDAIRLLKEAHLGPQR
ncbi:MAG: 1-acyl-sn-glycerol-3-phosphate acyltransferase [Elusimicrobia bacterium]|nr:1-acyl-sn-glycerol-3-phosphate acyltransferase [Elusimicrobiota bacterium]